RQNSINMDMLKLEEDKPSSTSDDNDEEQDLNGFGIITLASLLPIMTVQLLGILLSFVVSVDDIMAENDTDEEQSEFSKIIEDFPLNVIIDSSKAVIPLTVALIFILKVFAKENVP